MNRIAFIAVIITLSILLSGCEAKSMNIQAWMFPSDKTCDASGEIADGRHIDVLKPQYYALQDDGTLQLMTAPCNAYSATNVALVKKYSTQQYVTISGNATGMGALATNATLKSAFLNTLKSFLKSSGFTGVELDFEGFGQWTPQQYADYKALVTAIGNALHAQGCKLMIDGPAIPDATYQGYYPWRWEDFNALPVDYLVVMAYDEENDEGAGTPVASLAWTNSICQWMLNKIADHSKIVVGIPSYGYHAKTGSYTVTKDTYQQSTQLPGFNTATRDASSGEMTWTNAGVFYDYSDNTTLDNKLKTVQNTGIQNVSVWHLGGNEWFTQATPVPTSQPTVTLTADQIKAIYASLAPDQIATIRSITG